MHLDKIMEGDLEDLIEALIAEDERMRLEENHD
jgi:protein subunit release factor A